MYEDFLIIDSSGNALADLAVTNDNISREINGEFVLTFTAPLQTMKTEYLEVEGTGIIADNQTFDIVYFEKGHNLGGKIEYQVEAWHVFYRLKNIKHESFVADGTPAQILNQILAGSAFTAGTVQFSQTTTFIVNEPANACQLLYDFAAFLGAEIDFRNNGFTVDLLDTLGANNGFEICSGKNLKGIKKKVDRRQEAPVISYDVNIIELKNSNEYIEKDYSSLEVIGLGDTVVINDEIAGISDTQRIVKINYSPRYRKNTSLEIANKIQLFTDSVTRIQRETVAKNNLYNGIKISPDEGFVCIRSDGKAKMVSNATEGYAIYSDVGNGLEKNFYVDTNGEIVGKNVRIAFSGVFGNSITVGDQNQFEGKRITIANTVGLATAADGDLWLFNDISAGGLGIRADQDILIQAGNIALNGVARVNGDVIVTTKANQALSIKYDGNAHRIEFYSETNYLGSIPLT